MATVPLDAKLVTYVTRVFPGLTPAEQKISLALYRLLAEGRPVSRETLAARVALPLAQVNEVLGKWYGVFYEADGKIIGYWGLALKEMSHRLRINGRTLYAWCAWDTLFLPQIIGTTAGVESTCPESGDAIRLTVTPGGIEAIDPATTVISFVTPEQAEVERNVVLNFCHFVHFFRSAAIAGNWLSKHTGTRLLSLKDAWDLGREKNRAQYDAGWESPGVADARQDTQQPSCCAG